MKRRSFLKSAVSAIPVALTPSFAFATQPSPNSKEAAIVPAGHDRLDESHPGFGGLEFKVLTQETNGNLFVIEHANAVHGGPPLHLHLEQEEWFYVMEGEFLFQVGDKQIKLGPGESVLGPRKIPHTFAPTGPTPGRMLIAFSPAGTMEQFFRGASSPQQNADYYRKHGMELLGPPLKVT